MLKLDKHELFEVAKQFILVIGRCQFNVFAYRYNLRISVRSIIIIGYAILEVLFISFAKGVMGGPVGGSCDSGAFGRGHFGCQIKYGSSQVREIKENNGT